MKRTVLFLTSVFKNIRYKNESVWARESGERVCGSCLKNIESNSAVLYCPHCNAKILGTIQFNSEDTKFEYLNLEEKKTNHKFICKNKVVAQEYRPYDFTFAQIQFLAEVKLIVEENKAYIPQEDRDKTISYPIGLRSKYHVRAELLEPIFIDVTHEFSYDIYKKPKERFTLVSDKIAYDKNEINNATFKKLLKEICKGRYGLCGLYGVETEILRRVRNSNRLASTNLAMFVEPTLIEELAVKNNIEKENIIIVNPEATTLHEIMGISKKLLKDIREGKLTKYGAPASIMKAYHAVGDNYVGAFEIFDALKKLPFERTSSVELHKAVLFKKHNYDVNRLSEYLTEDIKWHQGITSVLIGFELLHDYLNMCDELDMPKIDKYPKSLKKSHDVVLMRYNDVKKDMVNDDFTKEVNKYNNLAYKRGEYSIIPVKTAKELVYEGSVLRHCVGSYSTNVAKGNTMIFFLRHTKEIDTPLVTLEVNNSLNVTQSRGEFNRALTANERAVVRDWTNNLLSKAVKDLDGNYIIFDEKKNEIA